MSRFEFTAIAIGFTFMFAGSALGQVMVKDAWVRGTVVGQTATGAYMEIISPVDTTLIAVMSPIATAELHTMRMENNVMHMREVAKMDLPAGKLVKFDPGGMHIMLTGLRHPLQKGGMVPIQLKFSGKDKKVQTLDVNAEVRDLTATMK